MDRIKRGRNAKHEIPGKANARRCTWSPELAGDRQKKAIKTTSERKLALLMGKYTAQDAIDCIQSARCVGELVQIKISA